MAVQSTFSTNGLQIYFQSRRAGIEAHLAAELTKFVEATQQSLDCAIYDFREPVVLEAFQKVANSGKRLRIAYDDSQRTPANRSADPKPGNTKALLEQYGLLKYATAVHVGGSHLMHNKFIIRDSRSIWTGSANFTPGGLELQDNNCLAIESPELAAIYEKAFQNLLTDTHVAHHTRADKANAAQAAPHPSVNVGYVKITPFSLRAPVKMSKMLSWLRLIKPEKFVLWRCWSAIQVFCRH